MGITGAHTICCVLYDTLFSSHINSVTLVNISTFIRDLAWGPVFWTGNLSNLKNNFLHRQIVYHNIGNNSVKSVSIPKLLSKLSYF